MAAEIRPGVKFATNRKPVLVGKVEGFTEDLNDAQLIPGEDGVITAGDDKTVQIWLKRDSGQYWPSVCQYVPSQASFLHIDQRTIFVGLDNGTVIEYELAADCNKLEHKRDLLSHVGRVTGIYFTKGRVFSVSRDKTFQWADQRTGNMVANYTFTAWCTSLQFDQLTEHAFIGDYSGQITMLKIGPDNLTCVTTFKGHSGSIRCLLWEPSTSLLFSGSFDSNVCVWDIGGKKGTVFELQGHKGKVTGLAYLGKAGQLISGGEDAILVAWNMRCQRVETPPWKESDLCELCKKPFFWNLKAMFDSKILGQRQHHCRSCGRAICDKCSTKRISIPKMGFEFQVRVCDECGNSAREEDKTSLASFHEAKHSVVTLSVDTQRNLLITVGSDRVIKIWDIEPLSSVDGPGGSSSQSSQFS
jgi:WD40 repeat protein